MGDLHFLIPNVKIVVVTALSWGGMVAAAAASDSGSVTTVVSIVTASAIVVLGGLFTLRNNLKTFWKERAEELDAKVKVLEEHAEQKLQERAQFAEEQRELRHKLKNELATAQAQLEVERAKHDMTAVYTRLETLEHTFSAGVQQQSALLGEILTELRGRPA